MMGPPVVVQGAQLLCCFGTAPSTLTVTSQFIATINYMPVATIMDMIPVVNIPPFGKCIAMAVATAGVTAVLPIPCVPMIAAPWTPGSFISKINMLPVLNMPAMCNCALGGIITVIQPSQFIADTL
jgi:hypothetical protein